MMKRILFAVFAGLMMLQIAIVPAVQALPFFTAAETPTTADPFAELKAKVLPELEAILTPEQWTQFEAEIESGTGVKKALKKVTLTPEEKGKIGMLMKSVPKEYFTSLTPMQKRELFMQKKDYFIEQGKAKAAAAIKTVQDAMTSAAE
ncbi:MAG TPA: hypothetical protein VL134_12110 [Leptolyngbya sp.]|jgi:hypothetical protein|nr:hypothetical protein [Leptolyngbya sp.]